MNWLTNLIPSVLSGWGRTLFIWGAVLAVSAAVASVVLYVRGAERAKAQVATLEKSLSQAETNARINGEGFALCQRVNAANAKEAEFQRQNAHDAAVRIRMLEAATPTVETVKREADTFRNDQLDCPALTPAFREWVRN